MGCHASVDNCNGDPLALTYLMSVGDFQRFKMPLIVPDLVRLGWRGRCKRDGGDAEKRRSRRQ